MTTQAIVQPDVVVQPDAILNVADSVLTLIPFGADTVSVIALVLIVVSKVAASVIKTPTEVGTWKWYLYNIAIGIPSLNWIKDKKK